MIYKAFSPDITLGFLLFSQELCFGFSLPANLLITTAQDHFLFKAVLRIMLNIKSKALIDSGLFPTDHLIML